jgi:hypothetical protein
MCPREWIVSPIQPDYGLDLRIELTQDGNVIGEEFYVQIKGREETKESPTETFPIAISQSTINYWLGKIQPVLIVLVDTSRQHCWFEWLEYAYPHYPNYREEKGDTKLYLNRNSVSDSLAEYVPKYLSEYFSYLRADISRVFESTQVTRMLFHVSRLRELCARMVIFLQQGTKDFRDEVLLTQWNVYAIEFVRNDMMLRFPWHLYANRFYERAQNIVRALESHLKEYERLRDTFLRFKDIPETVTNIPMIQVIPPELVAPNVSWERKHVYFDYQGLIGNLLPTMNLLLDIEEILFQILLIGRVKFDVSDS